MRPYNPYQPDFRPDDPNDHSPLDYKGNPRPGGGGEPFSLILGVKFWIPLFLFSLWILYPISGCAALGTLYVLGTLLHFFLPEWTAFLLAVPPALVVLWFACRWDCAMGQNKTYWTVRHIFRLGAIMGLLLYAVISDRYPHPTFGQVVHNVFSSSEILVVSLIVLGFLHWILVSKGGVIKSFWHDGLELIRLRPRSLESTEIISPKRMETLAEVRERLRKQNLR